jgi:hypothetical protein
MELVLVSTRLHEGGQMAPGHQGARFLKNSKIAFNFFFKLGQKNLDIDNY